MQQLLLFEIQGRPKLLQGDKTFTRGKGGSLHATLIFPWAEAHPIPTDRHSAGIPVDAKSVQDQLVAQQQLCGPTTIS